MSDYCCSTFEEYATNECPDHQGGSRLACPDTVLHKYSSDKWAKDKWGIPNYSQGWFTQIYFCPWCGTKTP